MTTGWKLILEVIELLSTIGLIATAVGCFFGPLIGVLIEGASPWWLCLMFVAPLCLAAAAWLAERILV